MTLSELLSNVRSDLGEKAVVDFDRDIATVGNCTCGECKDLYTPVHKLKGEMLTCPKCGNQMSFDSFHSLNGTEEFLDKTLFEIGIPLLHIVGGRVGMNTTYYEFAGDEPEVFEELRRD
jgi:adenylyltransferase/sulfurtransferase